MTPALALASCYNGSLADATTTKVQPLALVLSGLLSADVGFVDFDNPRQFGRIVTASLAQPLKHEPCGLLRDADLRMKLDAADAFAGRDEQIHCVNPLVQWDVRALEDGSGSDGEIEQAGVAAVEAALAGADAHRLAARRAGGPVRPAPRLEIDAGALLIGEHLKQFKSADGGFTHRASNPLPHPLHQQRRHRGHCSARKSLHTSPAQAEGALEKPAFATAARAFNINDHASSPG